MKVAELLKNMTVEEKAAIVAGTDFMFTNPVPRLGIRALCMADGPHGLRKQTGKMDNGMAGSEPSTAFPTAAAVACGWNTENARRLGEAVARECAYYGVDILLGPAVNIKRNPLCGRNFEYYSEDPCLAGEMAAAEICGLQAEGVGAALKHFALNNAENFRLVGGSYADMRAMREIYLKAFERAVKKGMPYTVMCAYNKINGVPCSENKWLLTDLLRGEWGFDGAVMTDWGAMRDRVAAVKAGLDLEMPGDTLICRKGITDAVKDGRLSANELDDCVRNMLELIEKCSHFKGRGGGAADGAVDFEAHNALAAEIAADCAVLMKNDGLLPLCDGEELMIAGDLFEKMRYQGAGSSMINPYYITSPKDAFDKRGVKYKFARGYDADNADGGGKLLEEAVRAAAGFDKVVVFAGLTDYAEFEGGDRESLALPKNQLALIDGLIGAGKRVVAVLFGGAVTELPFAEGVGAILNMNLSGQNCGTAVVQLLFGDKCPSGRLAESWVERYEDVPFGGEFSRTADEVYKESVFVGYRYYLTAQKRVAFPFGFGLSYTSFEYGEMSIEERGGEIVAACTVTNTGARDGAEVVQLYSQAPRGGVFKPLRELRAFTKLYLKAGESGRAELSFPKEDLRYFNVAENRFVYEGGDYALQICTDCQTVKLEKQIFIYGEEAEFPYPTEVNEAYSGGNTENMTKEAFESLSGLSVPEPPPVTPLTMESRLCDFKYTFWGKILYKAVMSVPARERRRAERLPDGTERENRIKGAVFLEKILASGCLRSMSMSSPLLPYNIAEGLKELSNGHIWRAIVKFGKRIRACRLPKDKK